MTLTPKATVQMERQVEYLKQNIKRNYSFIGYSESLGDITAEDNQLMSELNNKVYECLDRIEAAVAELSDATDAKC